MFLTAVMKLFSETSSFISIETYCCSIPFLSFVDVIVTRCRRGVRVVFSVTRMRSSNSARINKSDFTTEKNRLVYT